MVDVSRVMLECRNYFEIGYRDAVFEISGGTIVNDDLIGPGQYIAICDSLHNDGVYLTGTDALIDETFAGRVWYLHPPKPFLELCGKIAEFDRNTPVGALKSESFGEYSYSRATGQNGAVLTWQEAFARDLLPYRRMFTEVGV